MAATGATKLLQVTGATTTALGTTPDWELPAGASGAIFEVKVSNSSGFTTGFTVRIQGKDEVTGDYYQINPTPTAIAANGSFYYVIYPAAATTPGTGSDLTQISATMFIPPKGRVVCNRVDGTYDLIISMTPIVGV